VKENSGGDDDDDMDKKNADLMHEVEDLNRDLHGIARVQCGTCGISLVNEKARIKHIRYTTTLEKHNCAPDSRALPSVNDYAPISIFPLVDASMQISLPALKSEVYPESFLLHVISNKNRENGYPAHALVRSIISLVCHGKVSQLMCIA